ncbi:hypothetical protein OGATHE_003415 [Ogataea polymorpha]|uniref:Uncharacterized protein n=1 Tax=Ogataea polymorpha TaxID=460523 RepID=A0A9P8P3X9_9ASCO|nr:hypothetical protein OGATHE_003415 [Ogataea polymorpha]
MPSDQMSASRGSKFSTFRSLCEIPTECRYVMALRICLKKQSHSTTSRPFVMAIKVKRSPHGMNSITCEYVIVTGSTIKSYTLMTA